jgi:hypothetical protein
VDGRVLHFYLAGINNQNFLMRDKETNSWWQQITGKAISGPMKGASLELVLSDELTYAEWKKEFPDGKVLARVPKYVKEYDPKWEPEVAKLPVVISFPGTELKSRDVVVGLQIDGPGRAYPWETLVKQSPVMDRVQDKPLLVAVGPDGKSFRVFVSRVDGKDTEFFLKEEPAIETASTAGTNETAKPTTEPGANKTPAVADSSKTADAKAGSPAAPTAAAAPAPSSATSPAPATAVPAPVPVVLKPWTLIDSATASEWNFQGCAVSGPAQGKCLDRVPALKDYWFDWRNYHPETTIYKR